MEQWALEKVSPNNIAIILADETLLNPVLSILPHTIVECNHGVSSNHTQIASTVRLWIEAIEYAVKNAKVKPTGRFTTAVSAHYFQTPFCKYWYNEDTNYGPHEWNRNIIQANRVSRAQRMEEELVKAIWLPQSSSAQKRVEVLESIKNWLKHVAEKEKIDSMVINTSYKVHVLLSNSKEQLKGQK